MKNYKIGSENVFSSITRKIVKEELELSNKKVDVRFVQLEVRFDGLESRFDGLESRFDGLESRFDGLESRFDNLEHRFDNLEIKLYKFKDEIMNAIDSITAMFQKHDEEHEILRGDHARIIKIEEYLKI